MQVSQNFIPQHQIQQHQDQKRQHQKLIKTIRGLLSQFPFLLLL